MESAPPDLSTGRSGRRAEGRASRWKAVKGRPPARVPRPRLWVFLGPTVLGIYLCAAHATDSGTRGTAISGLLLAVAGLVMALAGLGLIRAQRRRYAALCSLPPGDAAVVLLGLRAPRWKVWRRLELPGELVRTVGASLPQAWVVGRSVPQNLVVELDRSVAQAVASRLRAVGADVEVVDWTGDRPRF